MKATKLLILITALAMLAGALSCNSPKRVANRSAKHWQKSYRLDKETNAGLCALTYNPKDSIHENTSYKPGKTDTVVTHDTTKVFVLGEGDTDTLYIYVTKYATITRVDTASVTKYIQEVNNAKIAELQEHQKKELAEKDAQLQKAKDQNTALQNTIAGQKKTISWWRMVALCALGYTLLRWVIIYFTKGKIKLP